MGAKPVSWPQRDIDLVVAQAIETGVANNARPIFGYGRTLDESREYASKLVEKYDIQFGAATENKDGTRTMTGTFTNPETKNKERFEMTYVPTKNNEFTGKSEDKYTDFTLKIMNDKETTSIPGARSGFFVSSYGRLSVEPAQKSSAQPVETKTTIPQTTIRQ